MLWLTSYNKQKEMANTNFEDQSNPEMKFITCDKGLNESDSCDEGSDEADSCDEGSDEEPSEYDRKCHPDLNFINCNECGNTSENILIHYCKECQETLCENCFNSCCEVSYDENGVQIWEEDENTVNSTEIILSGKE